MSHIIFFIWGLTVALLTGCGLECIDLKTGMHRSCHTLKDSKRKGVFSFEMKPDKVTFNLGSGKIFTIKDSWVEANWMYVCINNTAVVMPDTTKQLVVDGQVNFDSVLYSPYVLMEWDGGTGAYIGSGFKDFEYSGEEKFVLILTNHDTKEAIDTITFSKKVK